MNSFQDRHIPANPTGFPSVRIKIVKDYLVYYQISEDFIDILTVLHSRRNPKKFKL